MNQTISIIIPTLNEAKHLPETINRALAAAKFREALELIVVDAGSSDGTTASVEGFPVKIFERPDFILKKFASLNFGLQQASGEVVIFLDADTLLPYHFDVLIFETLKKKDVAGGAFEFSFRPKDFRLGIVELINRFRYRMDGIYFGDQAIFCTRAAAAAVKGFPENELMDAAFFCTRLKKAGKLKLISKPAVTSSRRFEENGYFRTFWFDLMMWLRFHLTRKTTNQREGYWRFNLDHD